MQSKFFQQVNYSASTEDGAAEIAALRLQPTDHVLCITASGARTLDLLTQSPSRIDSIDFAAPQNYLLQLKIAAYRQLDYENFRILMGLELTERPAAVLDEVLPYLPDDAQRYWLDNKRSLRQGVLYCGTWEKLLRWMSKTTILRRRHVRGLLEAPDLATQQAYWQKHWTGPFFRNYLRLLANRFLWVHVIREPGAKLIDRSFDVAAYLLQCLGKMAGHSLMRENPYANLLFYGHYTARCRLPIHLRRENYRVISSQLDRITVRTVSLLDYLASGKRTFDAYSLSDFSSYANLDQYRRIWQALLKTAQPGARYCERFFLVQHAPPCERLDRDHALEAELAKIDHTCIYTFHAGMIPCDNEINPKAK